MSRVALMVVALFTVANLSGCVVLDKANEWYSQLTGKDPTFRDVVKATLQGSFNVDPARLDPTRPPGTADDTGVRDSRTFDVAAGARELRMTVEVGFDNDAPSGPAPAPVPAQYVNLSLASPERVERQRLYTADATDSFSMVLPVGGSWTVSLVAVGSGRYAVVVTATQPDETATGG